MLAVLAVSLIFIMGSTYEYFFGIQEQQIKNQVKLVADGLELSGRDYFEALDIEGTRVTWITEAGTVLYDTEKSPAEMENHLERPEVMEAIASGYGESSRYSSTLLEKQLYCAQRLSDGSVVRISVRQSTVLTLLLSFARPICVLVLIILALGFLTASGISGRIVEPINNINLDNPLETDTYDELKPLLSRLSAQQNQIKKDNAELEKTVQIRQEFTSNVSHELKTPLHAISGYAELIQSGLAAEEDIRPFAAKIYAESVRMSRLVEDVIDLSKLDAGIAEQGSEETDLYRVAENAIESLESFSQQSGVEIHLSGEHAILNGVPQLLHSIIYNLCDNAIKYNHADGEVFVHVEDAGNQVILSVEDTGIGISEEHLSRIFERFYRVDKSHSKAVGGTGLGLSIVKHAAAMHNAETEIRSEPGKGTSITLHFPKNTDFT